MKKHILSKFSKTYEYQKNNNNHYDEITQVSYKYKEYKKDTLGKEWTCITESLENSDADEFICKEGTKLTFTMESSDSDELSFIESSEETRMIENSDADEFVF